MKIYALSDIHGYIDELNVALSFIDLDDENTILVFLGDYIHGYDSCAVLDRVIELQRRYGSERVITLMGNHEEAVDEARSTITEGDVVTREHIEKKHYREWIHTLKRYYKTEKQIFVHAGIDEKADELWEVGTSFFTFFEKYPPETGHFYMDIIAGHTGTAVISGKSDFHGIFYDGESHYYIDGSVWKSGVIPILMYDTDTDNYYEISQRGKKLVRSYSDNYQDKGWDATDED